MVPGIDPQTSRLAADLSGEFPSIFASAGIHPNLTGIDSSGSMGEVADLLVEPGVVAVGETGLDFYRMTIPKEVQKSSLRKHLEMAEAFGMTLIVHSRGAEAEVLEQLGDNVEVPVIMHCYTGPDEVACAAARRGWFIGFAGPLTYKKNGYLRELAGSLPPDRILAETDSPYLSPEPVRGVRNEPSNLVYIAETLAAVMDLELDSTAKILRRNALEAFQLGGNRRTDLVYRLYGNIYMNITGKCDNSCRFCIRQRTDGLGGYYLRHHSDPEPERLRSIIDLLTVHPGEELVFCGYGEPTMRPALLEELAGRASRKGFTVRLNTNGTCLTRMSADRASEMLAHFDKVSVSLNASCRDEYRELCRPGDPRAWDELLRFVELASEISSVRATAVRYPGIDTKAVKRLARRLGLTFRTRG
ncbi:MAG: radical SAM protein [Candidatus Aegiribacteria sp.]|nr:radical SAM protein [Candidatus Aegiribacteria sp.]MBD3294397.1 radical SAM protein [Candidatus Fermentibacteria bacterium]